MTISPNLQAMYKKAMQAIQTGPSGASTVMQQTGSTIDGRKWQPLGSRSADFKINNHTIRQNFINELRSTFGTKDFSKLPADLFDALKLSDFQFDAKGNVTSRRPLTARRIVTIIDKVTGYQQSINEIKNKAKDLVQEMDKNVKKELETKTYRYESQKPKFDAEKYNKRIDQLFSRPILGVSSNAMEAIAKAMVTIGAKPFHARLACDMLATINQQGITLGRGNPISALRTFADKIAKHADRILHDFTDISNPRDTKKFFTAEQLQRLDEIKKDGCGENDFGGEDGPTAIRLLAAGLRADCPAINTYASQIDQNKLYDLIRSRQDEWDGLYNDLSKIENREGRNEKFNKTYAQWSIIGNANSIFNELAQPTV